jgi:DNA-binding winged helix-turn-helix (wHTH) protein/TolB-like protein/Tfp pilus assembly protein PilF
VNTTEQQFYEFDEFRIDAVRRLLLLRGAPVRLKPRVFDTLLYLASHQGKVLDKDELMNAIWPDATVEENNLNQNVSMLRRALGESRGENRYIVTVPGRGYQFVASVRTIAEPAVESQEKDQLVLVLEPPNTQVASSLSGRQNRFISLVVVAVLAVVVGVGSGVWWWPQTRNAPVRKIAVLPFKPISTESGRDESLEFGMADTLIAKLTNIRQLVVRPLSAVRKYGGQEQDPVAAGRELGVDAVLDGHIQKAGNRIRMTTQLVRVNDAKQLWTGQFDEELTDIFAVQDSVSEKVAGGLTLELNGGERELLAKRYTSDTKAYELYLKGRLFLSQAKLASIMKAIGFLQEAIRKDPKYAVAYAALADCYQKLPVTSDVPAWEAFPKAREAALTALSIDGQLVEARTILGWIKLWHDWDWRGAEREFRLATKINPNYGFAHLGYAHLLSDLGHDEEAIREADLALSIDPISVYSGILKGHFLYQARRYTEAIDCLRRALELEPGYWVGQITLGKTYERAGRYEDAIEAFTKARDLSGGSSEPISLMGFTYAISGHKQKAQDTLLELMKLSERKYVPPSYVAVVYLSLGKMDEAVQWLERAYREKDVRMVFLRSDPKWDLLRSNQRFLSLAKRMNFVL